MQKNMKFCPRCGTPNNIVDTYCIKCGYNFKKRVKKLKFIPILIVILLLIAAWIGLRIFLKKPLVPTEVIELIKNMTSSKIK